MDDMPIADDPIQRGTQPGREWQVPGEKMADGSLHRPELKRFALKTECRSRICARHGPTPATSAPGHGGVCWERCGLRWEPIESIEGFEARSGASAAKSEHRHAPLVPTGQPLQCAAPQTRNQLRGTAALSTRRERVAMHRRLCRTGSRSRLCAVVRTSAAEFRRHGAQHELKPLARDADNQGARGRAVYARCNSQHATRLCPARFDTINARNGNHSRQQCGAAAELGRGGP